MRHLLFAVPMWLAVAGCPSTTTTTDEECPVTDGGCCDVYAEDDPCYEICECGSPTPSTTDDTAAN